MFPTGACPVGLQRRGFPEGEARDNTYTNRAPASQQLRRNDQTTVEARQCGGRHTEGRTVAWGARTMSAYPYPLARSGCVVGDPSQSSSTTNKRTVSGHHALPGLVLLFHFLCHIEGGWKEVRVKVFRCMAVARCTSLLSLAIAAFWALIGATVGKPEGRMVSLETENDRDERFPGRCSMSSTESKAKAGDQDGRCDASHAR
jgi:hypothetical protein